MPRTEEAFKQIRDERKERILQTAIGVFASKGLAGTKITDLAKAAGISQGLLYRYYTDKEEIFDELVHRANHGIIQLVQASLKRQGTSLEKLRWLTEQFLQGMSQQPGYYRVFSQTFTNAEKAHQIINDLDPLIKALRQIIIEGQVNNQIIKLDPDQLVLLYLICIQGLAANMSLFDAMSSHFPDAEAILHIFSNK